MTQPPRETPTSQPEETLGGYEGIVQRHWEQHLPKRLAAIPQGQRPMFFEEIADQIDQQVTDRAEATAAAMLAESEWTLETEPFLATTARLESARASAESEVLREMLPTDDRLPSDVPDDPSEEPTDDPTLWLTRDPDGPSEAE